MTHALYTLATHKNNFVCCMRVCVCVFVRACVCACRCAHIAITTLLEIYIHNGQIFSTTKKP